MLESTTGAVMYSFITDTAHEPALRAAVLCRWARRAGDRQFLSLVEKLDLAANREHAAESEAAA